MKPIAKSRRRGEKRDTRPPSPADEDQQAAVEAAARVLVDHHKIAPGNAPRIVQSVMIAFLGHLGFRAINNPELRAALTAEEPWSLMKLVDKDAAEIAAIQAALPVAAEIAAGFDPTGQKPLGAYSRDQIEAIFEAVIAVWEEHKGTGRLPKGSKFDDDVPF